jgi:hypothetical protein
MRALFVVFVLVAASYAQDSTQAWVGIAKGDEGVGSYFTEIRIGRTVYVSHDYCEAAGYVGGPYSARVDTRKNIIQLHAGKKLCIYHILDSHPLLKHGKETRRE